MEFFTRIARDVVWEIARPISRPQHTVELRIAIFPIPHSVNSRSEKHYFSRYTFQVPLLPCWITKNCERVWNLMIFNHQQIEAAQVRWNDNDKNQHWQFTIKWMIFSCVDCAKRKNNVISNNKLCSQAENPELSTNACFKLQSLFFHLGKKDQLNRWLSASYIKWD